VRHIVRIGDESTYDVVYDDVAGGSPRIGRLTISPPVVTIGPPYRRRSARARGSRRARLGQVDQLDQLDDLTYPEDRVGV